jgi:hypothetical protein
MLVVSVLIAAHVALIGLTFRSHLSVAMIGGVIGVRIEVQLVEISTPPVTGRWAQSR